jgi:dihydroorotate dehydrogenase
LSQSDGVTEPRSSLRENVDALIAQFDRFGLSVLPPEMIALDDAALAAVTSARARLLDLLQNDERIRNIEIVGETELEALLLQLIRLCTEGRLHHYLNEVEVPYPVYNFFAGFNENGRGPWDRALSFPAAPTPMRWTVFGLPTRMPIGVPASGLTANWRWIRYFARRGFNVLTYKTVRSEPRSPHCYPHWVFIADGDPWESLDDLSEVYGDLETWPKDMKRFSTANSFGVPSPHPEVWKADVGRALAELAPGQLLIVSVMGSNEEYSGNAMVDDFVRVARLAEETGAPAIELNLSCPNTVRSNEPGMGPPICSDPTTTETIVREVRGALSQQVKLVVKLSALHADTLTAVVKAIGDLVDGVAGINTVQVPIHRHGSAESPFIGTADDATRPRSAAGVSGSRIKPLGFNFVENLARIRGELGFSFSILGMGGVTDVPDVEGYVRRGADVVQTATGACLYPQLPLALSEVPDPWGRPLDIGDLRARSRLGRVGRALSTGGLSLVLDRDGAR